MVPLHSHKLLATLQHTLAGSDDSPQRNPLVARIETKGGHGAGEPLVHAQCLVPGGSLEALSDPEPLGALHAQAHALISGVPMARSSFAMHVLVCTQKWFLALNCFAHALAAGKPTSMVIAEVADMYAFAAKCIGAQWIGKADN